MPELAISLGSLLAQGAERLAEAGIPDPRRESLRIWSDTNGVSIGETLLAASSEVPPRGAALFQQAVQRRSEGEPLAHVTGTAGFRYLTLRSDPRALIPRPETEGLVDLLLQKVRRGVVADIGTGTGCIALSLALEGEFDTVIAVDSSAEALELARENAGGVERSSVVRFLRADLTNCFPPQTLDALISNPPYLTDGEYARLDRSVRDWEPVLALKAGPVGMDPTTRLLREGKEALRQGGWLALEVDSSRAEVARRAASENGWQDVSLHQDLFGRERYLLARRSDTR
jgi:release factor glutamine methyltransferase